MIRVITDYLDQSDSAIVTRYSYFVLNKLLPPAIVRKSHITIRITTHEELEGEAMSLKEYSGWVTYEGLTPSGKKKFTMILNSKRINRNAKKTMFRLRRIFLDLAHELVHIKQYLSNELFDYCDGVSVKFKGKVFPLGMSDDDDVYYNSPWEIEAYGREHGMYKRFKKMYDQEQKEKRAKAKR